MLDAGEAWFEHGDRGGAERGVVCGVFGRAAYLRFGDRVMAMCCADVAPGPMHLRIERLPTLRVGMPAVLSEHRLRVATLDLVLATERRWGPAKAQPDALARCGPLAAEVLRGEPSCGPAVRGGIAAGAPESTGLPSPILEDAARSVQRGDVAALARRVGGLGPGLTPAGDDLLAGVLVTDAALDLSPPESRTRAAAMVATTDISRSFLRWAATGQCIGPVHDVLGALAAGQRDQAFAACGALRATGATSGAALIFGMALVLLRGSVGGGWWR